MSPPSPSHHSHLLHSHLLHHPIKNQKSIFPSNSTNRSTGFSGPINHHNMYDSPIRHSIHVYDRSINQPNMYASPIRHPIHVYDRSINQPNMCNGPTSHSIHVYDRSINQPNMYARSKIVCLSLAHSIFLPLSMYPQLPPPPELLS